MNNNNLPTDTEINVKELPNIPPHLNQEIRTNVGRRWVILLIVSIVIGSLAGGILGNLNSKETIKTQTYTATRPINIFPIDIAILQNPMFSDWSGRLKGRIREIKQNSFTMSEIKEEFKPNGERIVTDTNNPGLSEIEVVPNLTKFFVSTPSSSFQQTPTPITYSELKDGAVVEGNVKIKYDASNNTFKLSGVSFTLR